MEKIPYFQDHQNRRINTFIGYIVKKKLSINKINELINEFNFETQGKQWPTETHRYCGNTHPIDYLSSYKTIFVHFKSDQDVEQTGFKFTASIISGL